jgi:hypothetical protein
VEHGGEVGVAVGEVVEDVIDVGIGMHRGGEAGVVTGLRA